MLCFTALKSTGALYRFQRTVDIQEGRFGYCQAAYMKPSCRFMGSQTPIHPFNG